MRGIEQGLVRRTVRGTTEGFRRMRRDAAEIRAEKGPPPPIIVGVPEIDPDIHIKVFREEKPGAQTRLPGTGSLFDFEQGKNI